MAIDYALVTAGNSTNLQGQTIIVDDASPEIFWDGDWEGTLNAQNTLGFIANISSHANTTHQSSNVGDSFTFQFAGEKIHGFHLPEFTNKRRNMEFTLDGNATRNTFTAGSAFGPHFVYFNATFDEAAGNHTLVAKVLNIAGSPLPAAQIDYITYKPTFVTIADKPKFLSPASSATGAPSAASSTVVPIQKHSSVGAIVGGVLGGCSLLALFMGAFYVLRRRRTKERDQLQFGGFLTDLNWMSSVTILLIQLRSPLSHLILQTCTRGTAAQKEGCRLWLEMPLLNGGTMSLPRSNISKSQEMARKTGNRPTRGCVPCRHRSIR
ncbi:hypothetical protein DFH06DRAFT_996938 [Mycena polygramma]|nr:hypothetical protein DFH06DRAFT_996938 [Mycena polygramma]